MAGRGRGGRLSRNSTTITAPAGGLDVNIVGPSPLQVELVNPVQDIEIVCASEDGRPLAFNPATGDLTELGGAAITDGSTAVACPNTADRESIIKCMENADGKWQVISFFDANNPTDIIGPIFCNPAGTVVVDPGDLVPCVDTVQREAKKQCWEVPAQTLTGTDADPFVIVAGDLEIVSQGGQGNALGPFVNTAGGLEFSIDGVTFDTWGNTVGGNGNQAVIDQDPLYIRNPATGTTVTFDITALTGGGSPTYAATVNLSAQSFDVLVYSDGAQTVCDRLGNEVSLPADAVQIECPSEFKKLCEIKEILEEPNKIRENCFERFNSLVYTLATVDTANISTNTDIEITPNESGLIEKLWIQIVNNNPFGGAAPDPGEPFSILVNGEVIPAGENTAGIGPSSGVPLGNIPLGRYIVCFTPSTPIQVDAGDTLVISQGLANDPNILWTAAAETDDFQADFAGGGADKPQIALQINGVETFKECVMSDGTSVWIDQSGETLSARPHNLTGVPCSNRDKLCEISEKLDNLDFETAKYAGKVCYAVTELQATGVSIPLDAVQGTLPDGTTWTFSQTGGTLVHSTTTAGDTRSDSNLLVQLTFSNPVELTAAPTNGGDVLNPITWQNQASGDSYLQSDGDQVIYNAGTFDAALVQSASPNRVTASLANAAAPDAGDPWGSVVAGNATQVFWLGRDAEALNFSVRQVAEVAVGDAREAYGCVEDGVLTYRDVVTNDVVVITDANRVDCGGTVEAEPEPIKTCYEEPGQTSIVEALETAGSTNTSLAALYANAPYDFDYTSSWAGSLTEVGLRFGPTGAGDVTLTVTNATTGQSQAQTLSFASIGPIGIQNYVLPATLSVSVGDNLQFDVSGTANGIYRNTTTATNFNWNGVGGDNPTAQLTAQEAGDSFCVFTDADGNQTAEDANGNAVDISGGIPLTWVEGDCPVEPAQMVSIDPACKQELADLINAPVKTVGIINYCITDPDDATKVVKALRRVLSDGTYGPTELLRDIAPDAVECC